MPKSFPRLARRAVRGEGLRGETLGRTRWGAWEAGRFSQEPLAFL
ncbi:hypothetical protein HMPREF0762_01058 [Slackia exigua ATCC 700122]|uniref:Uncharacterized protein n=1 Tax=Slackia exigua (strain ATCC 700122 / DSM 15923 / CIP 105133 / JCM 11022 / KCTC 5966 / S-7) TaxID=649764 RepID=D0WGV4_SLAES|nr:hypothetical protein HMPREF0762_01058 [Slackia exigua ATCC 700122]